ncbi:MAG: DUF2167 domain-containing protein [Dokdonella sp.]
MQTTIKLSFTLSFLALAGGVLAQAKSDAEQPLSPVQQELQKLHWVEGPTKVELFNIASIEVPPNYMFLNQADTEKFMTLNQNLSSGKEYLIAPDDLHWFGILTFDADGYVKDDESIDAASILDSIKQGTEAGNRERRQRGWPEMTVVGWKRPPYYDTTTKHLEWAIHGRDSNQGEAINFNTRILGRTGVTSAVLVADPQALDASIKEFKSTLGSYQYANGERYAEYKSGDKVAEYGLAALVAGGAAAIATKTGLWKTIAVALAAGWKFIAAGVVALSAAIGKFFKRKQS